MEYSKRPALVDAIQYTGENAPEIVGEFHCRAIRALNGTIMICTLEGWDTVNVGDYVIRDEFGQIHPCRQDIFESSYQKVEN